MREGSHVEDCRNTRLEIDLGGQSLGCGPKDGGTMAQGFERDRTPPDSTGGVVVFVYTTSLQLYRRIGYHHCGPPLRLTMISVDPIGQD